MRPGISTSLLVLFFGLLAACSPSDQHSSTTSRLSQSQKDSPSKFDHASQSPSHQPFQAETERISGYRTPAEYLMVHSRHYPEGAVAVTLPLDYATQTEKSYPLVIAFGGAGECARPPRDGALAWMNYYKTDEAIETLSDNRLERKDFKELTTEIELEEFNARLQKYPYQGIILACPSSPLISRDFPLDSPTYEAFLMEEVIPSLQKHYRIIPDQMGIDGVSMGGTRSMYFGLKYPQTFKSIGSVQGYFTRYMDMYRHLVEKNREVLSHRNIQLITSDGDSMASSVTMMHKLLLKNNIGHVFLSLTGPHDYIFNQGPGALSLLLFHNEALWFPSGFRDG